MAINQSRTFPLIYMAALVLFHFSGFGLNAQNRPVAATQIVSPQPLMEVVRLLEAMYAQPVTFEDPVWVWPGDMVLKGKDENAPLAYLLKDRRFDFPGWLTLEEAPTLNAAVLGRLLGEYNAQMADGTHFRVVESRLGLHIVPAQYHNAKGELVEAKSLLDARVSVPAAARMASGHLRALCDSITAVTGTKVEISTLWFDTVFAANGIVSPEVTERLAEQDKAQYSFVWGVDSLSARDALLSLLDGSATTLRWALLCQPAAKPEHRVCTLNLRRINVEETGLDGKTTKKTINWDRRPAPVYSPRPAPPL
jgi:hypothetical protein